MGAGTFGGEMAAAQVVLRRIAVLGVAGLLVAVGGGIGFLYASHPRDEAGFLRSVQGSWNDELRTFVDQSPEQVVSEGDRACEWLAKQSWAAPDLVGDVSGDVTGVALLARFAEETRGEERLPFSEYRGRMTRYIGLAAWRDLCGVTFELRHTHHLFARGND